MGEIRNNSGPSGLSKKAKKQKRKNDRSTDSPSKAPRLASPNRDDEETPTPIASSSKTSTADPMEALERVHIGSEDPMDGLAQQAAEEGMVIPTRADDFEQEAEREVEASKGLDGAVEEGKMKLVHQVRHQVGSRRCFWMTVLLM